MKVYHSQCPCKDCEYREVGCHSSGKCKNPKMTYEEWKQDYAEQKYEPYYNNPTREVYKRRRAIRREMK